jgi:hypothetical protein
VRQPTHSQLDHSVILVSEVFMSVFEDGGVTAHAQNVFVQRVEMLDRTK